MAVWGQRPLSTRPGSSWNLHRLTVGKAADHSETVGLLVPFHAVNRHHNFRSNGCGKGTQIGWGCVTAGMNIGDFSSGRSAPLKGLRMIGFRQVTGPHREIEGIIGSR